MAREGALLPRQWLPLGGGHCRHWLLGEFLTCHRASRIAAGWKQRRHPWSRAAAAVRGGSCGAGRYGGARRLLHGKAAADLELGCFCGGGIRGAKGPPALSQGGGQESLGCGACKAGAVGPLLRGREAAESTEYMIQRTAEEGGCCSAGLQGAPAKQRQGPGTCGAMLRCAGRGRQPELQCLFCTGRPLPTLRFLDKGSLYLQGRQAPSSPTDPRTGAAEDLDDGGALRVSCPAWQGLMIITTAGCIRGVQFLDAGGPPRALIMTMMGH